MAKPDCNDGWTPLAHELLAAILCARIPHEARAVLSVVFLQVYGPAKRKSARLDAPEVAKMTGIKRPNVWRGISFLVENGVLVKLPDGSYRFVKDYSKWGAAGVQLMTPELGIFSAMAPALAMSYKFPIAPPMAPQSAPEPEPETAEIESIETDTASEEADGSSVSISIRKPYQDGYATSIDMDTHSPIREKGEGRVVQCDTARPSENQNQKQADPVKVLPPTPTGPADPAMMQAYPGGVDPIDWLSGIHSMAESEAVAIYTRLWSAFGNMKVCREFVSHQRRHPAKTWKSAIRELVADGKAVWSIKIVDLRAGDIEVRPADAPRAKAAARVQDYRPELETFVPPKPD